MAPKKRRPTTPGEMLREEFLPTLGMTQAELAERMGVPLQRVNLICNDKRGVTADSALRLARTFAKTSPEYWMRLQMNVDIWDAQQLSKKTG